MAKHKNYHKPTEKKIDNSITVEIKPQRTGRWIPGAHVAKTFADKKKRANKRACRGKIAY